MNQLLIIKNMIERKYPILCNYGWEKVNRSGEMSKGIIFPDFFMRYVDCFNSSIINDKLRVYSPLTHINDFRKFVETTYNCLEGNDDLFEDKNFFPLREKLFPFANTIDGDGTFLWKIAEPEQVVFIDEELKVHDLKMNFLEILNNKNNSLEKIGLFEETWFEEFEIESNLKGKFISFSSKRDTAEYEKVKSLLLKLFNYNFKIKKLKYEHTEGNRYDAKKMDNCAFDLYVLEKRVHLELICPIDLYTNLTEIIKQFEALNLYVVCYDQYTN